MILPSSSQVLALADTVGWHSCVEKSREDRSSEGQFFTPAPIAQFLASWFTEKSLNQKLLHLLDPGAGGGALTAAFVERIVSLHANGSLPKLENVLLEVWELDKHFVPVLDANLKACIDALESAGLRASYRLHNVSFIEGAVRSQASSLFQTHEQSTVTHAILNPPYRKISTRSPERLLLKSVGIETSNLYAAFVSLALEKLLPQGELVAITPRSFCNGPYFRDFRRHLLEKSIFQRMHVFQSRSEAFGRDEVLQENVLYHLIRQCGEQTPIVLSTGSIECPTESIVPAHRFITPNDRDQVMHLAIENDAHEVRDFVNALPCTLAELGWEVSTGPVVDFRLKDSLSETLRKKDVPLLYPHCVRMGCVLPPRENASEYDDARIGKKPVAIEVNEETRRWLLPVSRFVLIKRFSSKEEKRRLVAGVLEPESFSAEVLGIENHLNFFHQRRGSLPAEAARGLCRFLNSSVADRYFRQFNGHTQVNASDLRAFRYPSLDDLSLLGKLSLDDQNQGDVDEALTKILGAPIFS